MSYIEVGNCKLVEDNKGTSDSMVGYYYCSTHQVRVIGAIDCGREKFLKKKELNQSWKDIKNTPTTKEE